MNLSEYTDEVFSDYEQVTSVTGEWRRPGLFSHCQVSRDGLPVGRVISNTQRLIPGATFPQREE